jgi:hypothetical protein
MTEEWHPIVGYEATYAVSNLGRVMRTAPEHNARVGHIMHLRSKRGYFQVGLTQHGYVKWHAVHKLVAEAFIGPKPTARHQVNHKDSDKTNNVPDNLEWVTPREHTNHTRSLPGHSGVGSENGRAKLTEQQVLDIRRVYSEGHCTMQFLADSYGVVQATINQIIQRRNWKHI